MKKTLTSNLILCAIPTIGIICLGCQEKSGDGAGENGADNTAEQTITADLSDNLDLTVVVALFGESENLEDFENKLNDPERQISNLDLNEDGEVDYLRVVESAVDQTHLVSVQAVLGEDLYQDVATFDIEKDEQGQAQVQIVGDPYLYGTNYVIRPTYERPPLITALFWAASYKAWSSPYSWGRYPSYYRPWRPYKAYEYRDRVSHHRHKNCSYGYRSGKRSKSSVTLYSSSRRTDYSSKHSHKSFDKRNKGVSNRYELAKKRGKTKVKGSDKKPPVAQQRPSGKPSTKPSPGKPSKPSGKPSTKPAPGQPSKPSGKPSTKPSPGKPSTKPSPGKPSKSSGKPATKPSGKPAKPSSGKPDKKKGK